MHTQASVVRPEALRVLRRLMADELFEGHVLVGGTALALQYGHRLSVDLDLFSRKPFDSGEYQDHLVERYSWKLSRIGMNLLMGYASEVKIDFVRHDYAWVRPLVVEQGIRMASPYDIAAMKLNAISQSGQRQKDFYDVYILLEHLCADEMAEAYEEKYPNSNRLIALRSLTYFGDVDFAREPALMARPIEWSAVTRRLRRAVVEPFRTFGDDK